MDSQIMDNLIMDESDFPDCFPKKVLRPANLRQDFGGGQAFWYPEIFLHPMDPFL